MKKNVFIIILLFSTIVKYNYAQDPLSFNVNLSQNIPIFKTGNLWNSLKQKYQNEPEVAGEVVPVNIQLQNGKWDTLSNGNLVWRVRVQAQGAKFMRVLMKDIQFPSNGRLFIYSKGNRKIWDYKNYEMIYNEVGTFTSSQIEDNDVIIEFNQLGIMNENLQFTIDGVVYGIQSKTQSNSLPCNIDVNCPIGDEWCLEKRSVCHITGFELRTGNTAYTPTNFSGVLINNFKNPGKAYILTARHNLKRYLHGPNGMDCYTIFYQDYELYRWEFKFHYKKNECNNSNNISDVIY